MTIIDPQVWVSGGASKGKRFQHHWLFGNYVSIIIIAYVDCSLLKVDGSESWVAWHQGVAPTSAPMGIGLISRSLLWLGVAAGGQQIECIKRVVCFFLWWFGLWISGLLYGAPWISLNAPNMHQIFWYNINFWFYECLIPSFWVWNGYGWICSVIIDF